MAKTYVVSKCLLGFFDKGFHAMGFRCRSKSGVWADCASSGDCAVSDKLFLVYLMSDFALGPLHEESIRLGQVITEDHDENRRD